MDFYRQTAFKVGNYYFNFRPDSDEEQEAYENQDLSKIGKGRTANIVHIDEKGTSYEQIINEGSCESAHEDIVEDINERLSGKPSVLRIALGTFIPLVAILIKEGIIPTGFTADNALLANIFYIVLLIYAVWLFFQIRNSRGKTVYLLYDISPEKEEIIQNFYNECLELTESEQVWVITEKEEHGDYKRNAGAESGVSRRHVLISYGRPPCGRPPIKMFRTNVNIPMICFGSQGLYFFPDTILYGGEKWLNAISYEDLNITLSACSFREEESIPSDAEEIGDTWKYVNSDGSPDRRFNDNYRIPILKYGEIKIKDDDDFCLTLHTSSFEIGKAFANALNRYKNQ